MVSETKTKSNPSFLKAAEEAFNVREGVRRDTKRKAFLGTVKRVLEVDAALDDVLFTINDQGEEVPYIEIAGFNFARDVDFSEVLLMATLCINPDCDEAFRVMVSEMADVWSVHKYGRLCPHCLKGDITR